VRFVESEREFTEEELAKFAEVQVLDIPEELLTDAELEEMGVEAEGDAAEAPDRSGDGGLGGLKMKASELREKNQAELENELRELKAELFKLRFQHVTNQLGNPMELKRVKRDIARVKTVMRQRELGEVISS
jgi:large subunit ribosomal protein L29